MKKKAYISAALFVALLAVLYLAALGFKLSYKSAARATDAARESLPSTDLSTLTVAGYRPGDVLSVIPDGFRGEIDCEDGKFFYSAWMREFSGDSSAISRLSPYYYTHVEYAGSAVTSRESLLDMLGESCIYQKNARSWYDIAVFLDKDHGLELHVNTVTEGFTLRKLGVSDLYGRYPYVPILENAKNPLSVLLFTITTAAEPYSDPRYYNWHTGFLDEDLALLPLYFAILLIPAIVLAVYRNKMALCVFLVSVGIYALAFVVEYWSAIVRR